MPCCAAVNCSNRQEKGVRLFRFPSNKARRALWNAKVKRDNWMPTSCSALCEAHFDDNQFERNRKDGWRKLRPDAVPTLFAHSVPVRVRKPPLKRSPEESPTNTVATKRSRIEHSYSSKSSPAFSTTTVTAGTASSKARQLYGGGQNMVSCSVPGCRNKLTKSGLRFFCFPSDSRRRELWRAFTTHDNLLSKYPRICEVHFDASQFEQKRQDGWRKLKWTAVPTLHPPPSDHQLSNNHEQETLTERQLATSLKLTDGEESHNGTSIASADMVAGQLLDDQQESEAKTSSKKRGTVGVTRETGTPVIRDKKILQSLLVTIAENIQRVSCQLQETSNRKCQLMQLVNDLTQEEIMLQRRLKKESDKENIMKQQLQEIEDAEEDLWEAEEPCCKEVDTSMQQNLHQHTKTEGWKVEERCHKELSAFIEKDGHHDLQIAAQKENNLFATNILRETSAAKQIELKLFECFVALTNVDDVKFVTLKLESDEDTNKSSDSNPGLLKNCTDITDSSDTAQGDDMTMFAESLAEKTDRVERDSLDQSTRAAHSDICVETNLFRVPATCRHVCCFCGERFWNAGARLSHELAHGKEFRCEICDKVFSNRIRFVDHKRLHTIKKQFGCTLCDRHFWTNGRLKRHLQSHTHEKMDRVECDSFEQSTPAGCCSVISVETSSLSAPSTVLQRKHTCSFCGERFWNAGARQSHELTHGKEFRCDICDKVFSYRSGFINHKKTHTDEKPFKCTLCDRNFKTNGTRKRHFRSHTREKHYACSVCSETFFYAHQRQVHMSVHTGKRPYTCQDCGRGFSSGNCLTRHVLIHRGEKPFECDVCGKRFRQGNQVKAHKEMHGEKPYVCSRCGKRLGLGSFWKHMKEHSGIKIYYECAVCDKKLSTKKTLEMHTRMVHMGEAPYVCDICYKEFGKHKDFQLHKKEHNQCSS